MSPNAKIIVVVGGTGKVGRSVALSLYGNPSFHIKVTTRDLDSEKAKFIKASGIEVIKADSWKLAELDEAFKGAWGVFLNTNSEAPDFHPSTGLQEAQMGKNVIDAASRQGVSNVVFAGLPEAEKVTNGNVKVVSFTNKNEISSHGLTAGFKAFTNVNIGWKMENFWDPVYEKPFGGFARVKDDEGYLTIKLFPMGDPPKPTPFLSVRDDYGDIVHGVFLDPEAWNTKTVWAVSDPITLEEVANTYNRVVGKDVARFVIASAPAESNNPEKAKEVSGVGAYSRYVNGYYCNGKPIDQGPAKELKRNGAEARGLAEKRRELQTFEGFVRTYAFN